MTADHGLQPREQPIAECRPAHARITWWGGMLELKDEVFKHATYHLCRNDLTVSSTPAPGCHRHAGCLGRPVGSAGRDHRAG